MNGRDFGPKLSINVARPLSVIIISFRIMCPHWKGSCGSEMSELTHHWETIVVVVVVTVTVLLPFLLRSNILLFKSERSL